jgi:bifunctional DNA-binding transcriptional regulator/antitoxin component of YhaV-PrlF toxin-antitoxin module
MSALPVTAERQITLSKELLEHLGVHPGDRIEINMLPRGILEMRAAGRVGQISDIFGLLKDKTSQVLSIDEINDVAARGWANRRRT